MFKVLHTLCISTAVLAAEPIRRHETNESTKVTFEETCKKMERYPLAFTHLSNRQLYEFLSNPSTETLVPAITFAKVGSRCRNIDRFPMYLRHSVLRQQVLSHVFPSLASMRSVQNPGQSIRIENLSDIMQMPIPNLVMSSPSLPAKLSMLIKSSIFTHTTIAGGRSPVVFEEYQYMIATQSRCTSRDFEAFGRLMGLVFLLNIPMGNIFNQAFYDILMGKRRGWSRADLEKNMPELSAATTLDQSVIDLSLYGYAKDMYNNVVYGFNEVVPLEASRQLINSKELIRILPGDITFSRKNMWEYMKAVTTPAAPVVNLLLQFLETYIEPDKMLLFITGKRYPPAGGLAFLMPPIRVELDAHRDTISADVASHTLYLPEKLSKLELHSQLSECLRR
jgi:hypothetical protein